MIIRTLLYLRHEALEERNQDAIIAREYHPTTRGKAAAHHHCYLHPRMSQESFGLSIQRPGLFYKLEMVKATDLPSQIQNQRRSSTALVFHEIVTMALPRPERGQKYLDEEVLSGRSRCLGIQADNAQSTSWLSPWLLIPVWRTYLLPPWVIPSAHAALELAILAPEKL